jgi:hypothetical protein
LWDDPLPRTGGAKAAHCQQFTQCGKPTSSNRSVNRAAAGNADWRVKSHDSSLTCPCVAPHTAKIHTLITLGVSILAKPLV